MKKFMLFASLLLLAGCADTAVTQSGSGTSDAGAAVDKSGPAATLVSYAAGDQETLEVPEMHCPFACYPKVKETLEGLDGVATVELVEQAEEGAINDPRVVVTFDGAVESKDAIAALDAVNFSGSAFESE